MLQSDLLEKLSVEYRAIISVLLFTDAHNMYLGIACSNDQKIANCYRIHTTTNEPCNKIINYTLEKPSMADGVRFVSKENTDHGYKFKAHNFLDNMEISISGDEIAGYHNSDKAIIEALKQKCVMIQFLISSLLDSKYEKFIKYSYKNPDLRVLINIWEIRPTSVFSGMAYNGRVTRYLAPICVEHRTYFPIRLKQLV